MNLTQLPAGTGSGYYCYASPSRQFGTRPTISSTQLNCFFFSQIYQCAAGIGDISLADGGKMNGHDGHRDGRKVDIRPIRLDRQPIEVNISEAAAYDRDLTQALIQLFINDPNVRVILFDDLQVCAAVPGVHRSPKLNHGDHFHVEFFE
jgi:hypothetical protein